MLSRTCIGAGPRFCLLGGLAFSAGDRTEKNHLVFAAPLGETAKGGGGQPGFRPKKRPRFRERKQSVCRKHKPAPWTSDVVAGGIYIAASWSRGGGLGAGRGCLRCRSVLRRKDHDHRGLALRYLEKTHIEDAECTRGGETRRRRLVMKVVKKKKQDGSTTEGLTGAGE